MKKVIILLIAAAVVTTAVIANFHDDGKEELVTDPVLAELPGYEDAECYKGEGFQDYTEYCKYYYKENVLKGIEESSYLKRAEKDDIDIIVNYFENFKRWIEYEDFKNKYDFDKECVSAGDYFYIDNNYTDEDFDYNPEKYPTYNVYWYDRETLTMYFIHNNV